MISPHGTELVPLNELVSAAVERGGIRVTYTSADVVLVNGALEDQGVGYSAIMPLAPAPQSSTISSSTIAELGLMSGPPDSMMRFPSGTVFTPYTVLRNISNEPLTATPRLWWMAGGVAQTAELPSIAIAPYNSKTLDIPAALAAAGLGTFAGSVNLVFDVRGTAGGLLVTGGAVDQSNSYVFNVVPRGISWSAGKSLSYWSTANGDDTMITLWNPADEAQDLIFRLDFAGGHYRYPVHLGPRATQTFNISDIVSSNVPDDAGNVIPTGVQEGSAELMGTQDEVQHILVAMDSGIYNVVKATCGSYQCETCDGVASFGIVADPWETSVTGSNQLTFTETYNNGNQYNVNGQSNWNSSATNVATVGSGLINGVGAGAATIDVVDDYTEPGYTGDQCGYYLPPCPIYTFTPGGSSGGSVTDITITGIVPSRVPLGTSGPMTITGTNFNQFSGTPTVETSGGFSVAVNSVSPDGSTLYATYYAGSCSIPLGTQYLALYGGIYDGGAGGSSNTWPVTITAPQLPTPMIGYGGNNNINGSQQQVVVGQQVALTTSEGSMPACAGSPVTNGWSFQGTVVGGYNASTANGSVSVPTLSNPSANVYWVYAGNNQVQYSYCTTTGFCSPTATATFDVSGVGSPNITIQNEVVANVNDLTGCSGGPAGGPELVYGNLSGPDPACGNPSGTAGMTFLPQGSWPGAGTYFFAQVINSDQSSNGYNASGKTYSCTDGGGIDGQYPYQGAYNPTSRNDAPTLPLPYNPNASRNFNATMYLMWQSSTANSIAIPVGSVPWTFNATATCSSGCGAASGWVPNGAGGPTNQSIFVPSSPSQPFSGFPTWSGPATTNCSYQ